LNALDAVTVLGSTVPTSRTGPTPTWPLIRLARYTAGSFVDPAVGERSTSMTMLVDCLSTRRTWFAAGSATIRSCCRASTRCGGRLSAADARMPPQFHRRRPLIHSLHL